MFPIEREGNVTIAHLGVQYSSLDDEATDEARVDLLALADRCEPALLIFDLSDVEYISSMFLEALFRCHSRIKRRGGRFALSGPSDLLRNVLHVTRLDTLFCIHATRAEAIADLAESATLQPAEQQN